ncbi:hypothetical protein, partial [Nostoc flagelliforme]|uniref:hypothetical protein n=1 Tax=Nostoc flagelliforme TaxID=1306274 RepID=UPI001A7F0BE1
DSTTGEISENSLSCIQHQCIQGITLTLPDFGLNRTVLSLKGRPKLYSNKTGGCICGSHTRDQTNFRRLG